MTLDAAGFFVLGLVPVYNSFYIVRRILWKLFIYSTRRLNTLNSAIDILVVGLSLLCGLKESVA